MQDGTKTENVLTKIQISHGGTLQFKKLPKEKAVTKTHLWNISQHVSAELPKFGFKEHGVLLNYFIS
jgi:hypothetical protein